MYKIKQQYKHREVCKDFDDTSNTDNWQKEVYEKASEICRANGYKKIIDVGTGSGYKLIKYLGEFETVGYDIPRTIAVLRNRYPDKHWRDDFVPEAGYDFLIASDVIEHFRDPIDLIDFIRACNVQQIIFSTPDRDLIDTNPDGPPKNRSHYREWNFAEFREFLSKYFEVLEHYVSNHAQGTQVIVAKYKEH